MENKSIKNLPEDGLDLTGLGKLAKAIPPAVYEKTTDTITATFEKLVAPITETTAGLGNYVRQKFENMVVAEKALATYSIEQAFQKARTKRKEIHSPVHPKSFILALEHVSKETNLYLHELWVNLLTSQITDSACHPHFVEVLPHLSPKEAQILTELFTINKIGSSNEYLGYERDGFNYWVRHNDDREFKDWTYSCTLLLELGLAGVMALTLPKKDDKEEDIPNLTTILYLASSGHRFLQAVNPYDKGI